MNEKLEIPIEQFAEAVEKENARLTECLEAANKKIEHFEREYYLAKDRIEYLENALRELDSMVSKLDAGELELYEVGDFIDVTLENK